MPESPLLDPSLPEGQASHEPSAPAPTAWYRRRATKVTAAGIAATGLVVGGFGVYAAASATLEPAQAIEQAFHNLTEEPVEVTFTSADEKDSSITLTHTDEGTQVGVVSPEATFEALLDQREQRLYLRVDADSSELTDDPFVGGMLAGFTSVEALLKGEWVSLDVSEDSQVMAALSESSPAGTDVDSDALTRAGEELGAAMTSILGELKDPAISALTDHAAVTTADGGAESDGSEHYRVELDVAAARADLEDDLRAAVDDALAALDDFAGTAGEATPGLAAGLPKLRDELAQGLDDSLPEEARTESVELFIADEHFTRIVGDDLTLTFDADPALDDVSGAVAMDDDLVRLLPMVTGLMALGDLTA